MEQILERARSEEHWLTIQVFLYLQLLDLLTTLVGLRFGASEVSPFVRMLMQFGPATGVLFSKLLALLLGATCVALRRHRLIRRINYWFAALVVWNLIVILSRTAR